MFGRSMASMSIYPLEYLSSEVSLLSYIYTYMYLFFEGTNLKLPRTKC